MPKIIDIKAKKQEIAFTSTSLFMKKGYFGTGMREIGYELEISKAQLYTYFKNKEDLFQYCFELFLETAQGFTPKVKENDSQIKRIKIIVSYYSCVVPEFGKELSLMTDYLRPKTQEEKQRDFIVKRHNESTINSLKQTLGVDKGRATIIRDLLIGSLTSAYYSGDKFNKKNLEAAIHALCNY